MEFRNNISAAALFLSSLALLALGIAMIFKTSLFLKWIPYFIGVVLTYTGLTKFFSYYNREKKNEWVLLGDTVILVQGILSFFYPNIALVIFPAFVAFYSTIISIISFIVFYQYVKARIPFSILMFFKGIIFAIITISVLVANVELSAYYISILTGIYLIFYANTIFHDFLNEETPKAYGEQIKRKMSVRLPVLFTANVLSNTLKKVNEFFNNVNTGENEIDLSHSTYTGNPDLSIFIHVKEGGIGAFGHVDFYFEDYVISYGNYDAASIRGMGALGEGVMFFIKDKNKYIQLCNTSTEKTIFEYGIKLTYMQKKKMEEKIREYMDATYSWLAPVDRFSNRNKSPDEFDDYASSLSKNMKVLFRKFKKGKFKYYFSLYSNCVKFADSILGTTGIDILQLNGVISPGAYFNYFDREYRKTNTNVVSKKVYNPKGIVK